MTAATDINFSDEPERWTATRHEANEARLPLGQKSFALLLHIFILKSFDVQQPFEGLAASASMSEVDSSNVLISVVRLLIDLNKCRAVTGSMPWRCHEERCVLMLYAL